MRHHDHSSESALLDAAGEARRHLDGGNHDRAEAVLSPHLSAIDLDSAGDHPVLIDAACPYAGAGGGERNLRLRWGAYAFDAGRRTVDVHALYGVNAKAASR
jgi:hypothetical protein